MKVILVNGSPHEKGCTYTALNEVLKSLLEEGIDGEIFQINKLQQSCIGCGFCKTHGKCAFGDNDGVNLLIEKAKDADGFVFGSPVHFASATGMITSFMDRFFMASKDIKYKPACAIVSCRRGGASAALDQLNKYFTIRNMPVVSSNYWNMVHGSKAEDVYKDEEGMQTMRILGKNLAWMLENIKKSTLPTTEDKVYTNYVK